MKSLVEYILEERNSIFNEIKEYALSWIDYMYNEGVINYDDRHLVSYADNKSKPDFNDIVKGILNDYKSNLSDTTKIVLSKYLKNGSPKDKESAVENAILASIEDFVEKGNCRNF